MRSVYIRKDFYAGLRRISRKRRTSVGSLVNDIVREQLEETDDVRVADARCGDQSISLDEMQKRLNRNGAI
jgi:predicted DNA-binding ribbon-helix-helix protein